MEHHITKAFRLYKKELCELDEYHRKNNFSVFNRLDLDQTMYNALVVASTTMEAYASSSNLEQWHKLCQEICGTPYPKKKPRDNENNCH